MNSSLNIKLEIAFNLDDVFIFPMRISDKNAIRKDNLLTKLDLESRQINLRNCTISENCGLLDASSSIFRVSWRFS